MVRGEYDRMKEEDLAKPGRDWWPAFYTRNLKDRDPHHGQAVADVPPIAGSGY